jgi:hypothetical protein
MFDAVIPTMNGLYAPFIVDYPNLLSIISRKSDGFTSNSGVNLINISAKEVN